VDKSLDSGRSYSNIIFKKQIKIKTFKLYFLTFETETFSKSKPELCLFSFESYAAYIGSGTGDIHILTRITHTCEPCHIDYDIITKTETLYLCDFKFVSEMLNNIISMTLKFFLNGR